MKFKVTLYHDDPERRYVIDESNFIIDKFGSGTHLIGLDGKLYENYGTGADPLWEEVFDANYKIELI